MIVYFVRHGETELNRMNIVQGSGMDADLNALGREQARAFFEEHKDVPFELIVTSRLKRTHQTVQPFLDKNIPWHQTADINEISWGVHEGKAPSPEQYAAFRHLIAEWQNGNLDAALPEGESARQLGERVARFLAWLQERPEKMILVATHGRTLRALISLIRGASISEMEKVLHVNTGCYIVQFKDGTATFHSENDVRHLEKANLQAIQPA